MHAVQMRMRSFHTARAAEQVQPVPFLHGGDLPVPQPRCFPNQSMLPVCHARYVPALRMLGLAQKEQAKDAQLRDPKIHHGLDHEVICTDWPDRQLACAFSE